MSSPSRESEIVKVEKTNRKKLKELLLLLFLGTTTPRLLLFALPKITKKLQRGIFDLHSAAYDLADEHTEPFTDLEDADRKATTREKLLIAAAASNLVAAIAGATQVRLSDEEEPPTLQEAVEGALSDVEGRVDRIATQETMRAYNARWLDNLEDVPGAFVWNATLDRRTCPRCAALDGKSWVNLEDVPAIPAHILCRCVLDFEPA